MCDVYYTIPYQVIVVSDGRKRRLVIKDTLLSDAGEISARTNQDQADAKLRVAREYTTLYYILVVGRKADVPSNLVFFPDANRFITGLPGSSNVVERESATFAVQVYYPLSLALILLMFFGFVQFSYRY